VTALAKDLDARSALAHGLARLGIELPGESLNALLRYVDLLEKWNRVYNLTAVRGFDAILRQHLLDSLSILRWTPGARLLDVGSGAGLPGVPIAIAQPATAVTLLDASEKKTAFLHQVAAEIDLPNVAVVRDRVEHFSPGRGYDVVVTRAFTELGKFAGVARRLLNPAGRLVAMKGLYPNEELAQLPSGITVTELERIEVPGLDAERHVVVMTVTGTP
jgi:16S rRNA (guanine527-N7)-methyltransferase